MASTGVPSYSGPAAPGAVPAVKNNSSHDHNGTTEKSRKRHSLRHPSENSIQSHLVASAGEFVGTFMFLYIAYMGHIMATNHVSPPPTPVDPTPGEQSVLIIAVSYGFSLLVNVWAFYRISGGLFNPAVTLGLCLSGQLSWLRAVFLVPAQLLAAMCAGGLVQCMVPGQAIGNANTVLGSDTTTAQGVFLEMFFTAQLVFVVLMLAIEKSRDTFLAPIGIGFTLFVVMVAGTAYTGASLNPARSLGCAVPSHFPSYHWIYWVGPGLGAALAAAFYRFVKFFHYEEANPGQDATTEREMA